MESQQFWTDLAVSVLPHVAPMTALQGRPGPAHSGNEEMDS